MLARREPDERRDVPSLRRPHHAGGRGARAHAAGGHRGGDVRRARPRAEGRDDRQPRATARATSRPRRSKEPASQARIYIDSLGLDSAHDYDPFWARCAELRVAVTAHSGSMGWNGRESINSFTYNHIGHFANASHAFAKALVLGGRHPSLPPAPLRLPGGRRGLGLQSRLGPRRSLGAPSTRRRWRRRRVPPTSTGPRLEDLFRQYGGRPYADKLDEIFRCINLAEPFKTAEELTTRAYRETFDDFAAVPVASGEALRRHFAERFYFGCEADDPMTAWAFDRHGNHRLRPDLLLRRRPLRRGGHERGARGGLGAGRARPHRAERTSGTSSSSTRCACTPP